MVSYEEFLKTVIKTTDTSKLAPADRKQLELDYARYARRQRDPLDQKKREEAQDACVRAHARELAGDFMGLVSANSLEDWFNRKPGAPPDPGIRETRETREAFDDWMRRLGGNG